MIKYIFKHIRRGIISNILFCLLLGLAGAMLCISAGLWFSAFYALQDLDDTLTTIAVPDSFHIERFAESNDISYEEVIQSIRESIYTSDLLSRDTRRIFNAVANDINPVALRATGLGLDPRLVAYSARPIAAFVVTCEKIDYNHHLFYDWDEETSEQISYIQREAYGSFTVDEVLHLNDEYSIPRFLNIAFHANPDGSHPFEIRQQYVVMGAYTPGGGFTTA